MSLQQETGLPRVPFGLGLRQPFEGRIGADADWRREMRHISRSAVNRLAVVPGVGHNARWPQNATKDRRMYAISFDLDQEQLKKNYHNQSYNNAYEDIRKVLEVHHFTRQQGSVYFGDVDKVTAVSTVLAVQDLARQFSWFWPAVSDIRMLRIEENNDLMPAVEAVTDDEEDEGEKPKRKSR
jgi:virulence-associated protein VapD